MKNSIERELLSRFNKAMIRIVYGDPTKIEGPVGKSLAAIDWDSGPVSGLRMAANDMVEMMQGVTGDDLAKIDRFLEQIGAATLSQLRDKGFRRAIQLMSLRKLKKEEDAYLLKSLIDSQDERFSSAQLLQAEKLLMTFENNS